MSSDEASIRLMATGLDMIERAMEPTPKRQCDHNEMVSNDDPLHVWKCAKCGYVFGVNHSAAGGTDAPAVADTDGPDCCSNCVNWRGKDGQTFGYCPVVDFDTADSSTCEKFELRVRIR